MATVQAADGKALFRRFHEAMNTHDVEVISATIDELFEPDVVVHTPAPVDASGRQAMKDVFGTLHRAYPTCTSPPRI